VQIVERKRTLVNLIQSVAQGLQASIGELDLLTVELDVLTIYLLDVCAAATDEDRLQYLVYRGVWGIRLVRLRGRRLSFRARLLPQQLPSLVLLLPVLQLLAVLVPVLDSLKVV